MELSMDFQSFDVCAVTYTGTGRQSLDTDIVLPDYCGDIKRILHCETSAQLHSVGQDGERLRAEGETVIRLLYINDDNQPDCFAQHLPLSVVVSVPALDANAVITARAATDYLNCRALNPRKITVNGTVSVHFEVLARTQQTSIRQISEMEQQSQTVTVSALRALTQKTFDLSETVSIGTNQESIGKLLHLEATPLITGSETVDDKLLLKGNLSVDILYLTEDGALQRFNHALPISQIVEAAGLQPDSDPDIRVQLLSLYAQPKRDGADENRLLELAAKLSVLVQDFEEQTQNVITDCYAISGVLQPTFTDQCFLHRAKTLHLHLQNTQTVETGLDGAALLQHIHVQSMTAGAQTDAEETELSVQVLLSMLLKDKAGELRYLEKDVSLVLQEPLHFDADDAVFDPQVRVRILQTQMHDNGKLDVQLEMTADGSVFEKRTESVLTNAALDNTVQDAQSGLVLSFSKQGESLWDIAKRYRTREALILSENGLTEHVLQDDRLLLIPFAG